MTDHEIIVRDIKIIIDASARLKRKKLIFQNMLFESPNKISDRMIYTHSPIKVAR